MAQPRLVVRTARRVRSLLVVTPPPTGAPRPLDQRPGLALETPTGRPCDESSMTSLQ